MPKSTDRFAVTYRDRHDFRGPPRGRRGTEWKRSNPIFVIQKHDARTLHYDLRLEVDGVLKSWAVPKGPSTSTRDKRLAVRVEDHAIDHADFEGVISEHDYGSGAVIVWDAGPYRNLRRGEQGRPMPMRDALAQGVVEVWLEGKKIRGGYALVRTKMRGRGENWLLIKMKDEGQDPRRNPVSTEPRSVLTGRTIEQVARDAG